MTNHLSAKLIKSLHQKKYRQETKKFFVEGDTTVVELLSSDFKVDTLYATKEFLKTNARLIEEKKIRPWAVDASELEALGTLERNTGALAIVMQKMPMAPKTDTGITLVLDDIRDPGNLGTLIRIADWYGISNIVCSTTCVDWYNPKVISATMGSFARVSGFYTDLPTFLAKQKKENIPIFGTFLSGTSIHKTTFPETGILIIGSESHGISKEVTKSVTAKITIPRYGKAESLNAAVAGAIVLDAWKAQN